MKQMKDRDKYGETEMLICHEEEQNLTQVS